MILHIADGWYKIVRSSPLLFLYLWRGANYSFHTTQMSFGKQKKNVTYIYIYIILYICGFSTVTLLCIYYVRDGQGKLANKSNACYEGEWHLKHLCIKRSWRYLKHLHEISSKYTSPVILLESQWIFTSCLWKICSFLYGSRIFFFCPSLY